MGFGKLESMRYVRYLHQCLKELETGVEYETDTTLIYLVRVQRLSERITQCNSQDHNMDELPMFGSPPAPRSAYVSAFQVELDQIRQELPTRLKMDSTFKTSWLRVRALVC